MTSALAPPSVLPRAESVSTRSLAAASQRDRLLVAVVGSVVANGYAVVTVSDVIARAGVSRRTFYEHFRDREECFLAAYDRGVQSLAEILDSATTASEPTAGWRALLRSLLSAYLETLAGEPGFAQVALIDILAAGPNARARYVAAADRFHVVLRALDDQAGREDRRHVRVTDAALSVLGGGLNRLVLIELLAGRSAGIPGLVDDLYDVAISVLDPRSAARR